MHEYWPMIGRTVLAFIMLLLISRILGKQTISNMTFHDFATGITMGAIAASLAFFEKIPALYLVLCLATLTAISYISSVIAKKFQKTRHILAGAPTVIIEKGKLLESNMRKINYTLDSLNQSLREKDVFNVDEIEYAVLETNGKLSILKKDPFMSATKKDLKIASKQTTFPIELVMDGKIVSSNLIQNNISEDWVMQQIKVKGKTLPEIFYAVKTTTGKLIFDYYEDNLNRPVDKE